MTTADVQGSVAPGRDRWHADRAVRAEGLLAAFNQAEVITSADIQVATTLGRLAGESDPAALLGAAMAVRALRGGAVCLDPADVVTRALPDPGPTWPEVAAWTAALRSSPLTGPGRPLIWDLDRLYLHRYHEQESQVCADLLDRQSSRPPAVDRARLDAALHRLFRDGDANQRLAAEVAASRWTTVVGGGPGTGKTTTVARMLAVLADVSDPGLTGHSTRTVRIGLAAPTGKAAARLQEAVQAEAAAFAPADRDRIAGLTASTVHRLLGWEPGSRNRFAHRRSRRLPHDIVVVDEASMLSLTLTARLLEAMRPDARLILVGDPSQLESVEAGVVLADLVAGLTARARLTGSPDGTPTARAPHTGSPDGTPTARAPHTGSPDGTPTARARGTDDLEPETDAEQARISGVVTLTNSYRFHGGIADLASAIRSGDADRALAVLESGTDDVEFGPDLGEVVAAEMTASALRLVEAAELGDADAAFAALARHRLLCAHRSGPAGVALWNSRVAGWVSGVRRGRGEWFAGRPLLVVRNDITLGLYNGDTGVTVRGADGGLVVLFQRGTTLTRLPPSRLSTVETAYALTVHRSQGSQYDQVSLILPPLDSPLLTRELLYTAVTRARHRVRILGGADQIRLAIATAATRASGLRERLARA